jgi:molybdopterin synthase catalytic subunit
MFKVTTEPLSIDEAYAAVRRDDCGAVALFVGTVRDHHDGKKVTKISYSAFQEMAVKEFAAIATEAAARWKIGAVYIAHRTGPLAIGDASVVIAVSAPHRAEAFEAAATPSRRSRRWRRSGRKSSTRRERPGSAVEDQHKDTKAQRRSVLCLRVFVLREDR